MARRMKLEMEYLEQDGKPFLWVTKTNPNQRQRLLDIGFDAVEGSLSAWVSKLLGRRRASPEKCAEVLLEHNIAVTWLKAEDEVEELEADDADDAEEVEEPKVKAAPEEVAVVKLKANTRSGGGTSTRDGDATMANDGASEYRHESSKRVNLPPARLAAEGHSPKVKPVEYALNPHLPPTLRFDPDGTPDGLAALIEASATRPLTESERARLAAALRSHEPWLEWSNKQEEHRFRALAVDPVVLHEHERVSARAIVSLARRQQAQTEMEVQGDLFARSSLPYHEALKFYQHQADWTNRLILGDSLQVMASLAERENLAGQVQMIFIDPPYGIKYASNFQPELAKRDVRDRDDDLTREAEVVRAFRDTWTLGVHSYLSYLRARLLAAHRLLHETGSVFLQISDENVHRVRLLMDEVFGPSNFRSMIVFSKTTGSTSDSLASVADVILWYGKSASTFYQQLYEAKRPGEAGATGYKHALLPTGEIRSLATFPNPEALPTDCDIVASDNYTSQSPGSRYDVELFGRKFRPEPGYWKTDAAGMARILGAERLVPGRKFPGYLRRISDFPAFPISNIWTDTVGQNQFGGSKLYSVQTALKVIERCMLMSSRPGDLVIDPTCGSGSTSFIAEELGRRWIAIDTSRVAIAIARQRILTATFKHYKTNFELPGAASVDPKAGFIFRTVAHVMPSSITQNRHLDPIFAKHQPHLDRALAACNAGLAKVTSVNRSALTAKLLAKQKADGKRSVTDADERRWQLPKDRFEHWSVPFDTDDAWPDALQSAVATYRRAWRAKMEEVDACIQANAEQEVLVDQPEVVKGVTRVSGPFTVEGVMPAALSPTATAAALDADEEARLDTFSLTEASSDDYLHRLTQLLRDDGVSFPNNRRRKFARLERMASADADGEGVLHAAGEFEGDVGDADRHLRVAVSFGPQYGPITSQQVEDCIRAARRAGFDHLVLAGFSFAPEATNAIEGAHVRNLTVHRAHIRPDVNPAMDGLLKDQGNWQQLFTVYGEPEVEVKRGAEGYTVTLTGVDIYDPVAGVVRSSGADKVAAWFLDPDHDGRTFCVGQAFFPDKSAWEKIAKALKSEVNPEVFETFSGTRSLPFPAGRHRCFAVKVIDPRGNEVMVVRKLEA